MDKGFFPFAQMLKLEGVRLSSFNKLNDLVVDSMVDGMYQHAGMGVFIIFCFLD